MGAFTPEPAGYTVALDYNASGNLIYFGKAAKGTSKAAAAWAIASLSYDADSNLTDIQWAAGNTRFDNVWNDRTSLSYS